MNRASESRDFDSGGRIRLVLSSDLVHLDRVVEEVEAFTEAHFSDADFVYRVVLVATEAVTNAMEHGNGLDPSKQVVFEMTAGAGCVSMSVEDEGVGFDPEAVRDPLAEGNLLREGGRGIFLIQTMADAVRYELEGRRLLVELCSGG